MKMNVVVIVAIVVIVGIVLGAGIWMQRSRPKSSMHAKRAQNVFNLLQTGQYQQFEAEFNSASRDAKIPKLLADEWARLVAELGPFKECTVVRAEPVNYGSIKKNTVHLICEFQSGKRYVAITYDTTESISGFSMGESEH
jgi:hypothetical protein